MVGGRLDLASSQNFPGQLGQDRLLFGIRPEISMAAMICSRSSSKCCMASNKLSCCFGFLFASSVIALARLRITMLLIGHLRCKLCETPASSISPLLPESNVLAPTSSYSLPYCDRLDAILCRA